MSAVVEQKKIVQGGGFLIEERTPEEIFTPEDFTEEHRMIADTTRQFIDNEVIPRIDELESTIGSLRVNWLESGRARSDRRQHSRRVRRARAGSNQWRTRR